MKGQKVIIPTLLKQQYIDKIHAGHTGIGSCLKKAREFIFWVNYSKDIQEAVEKCSLCQEQQNVLMTNQCYVSEVPLYPWNTLGSDLFYHKRLDFLVVVDYFSKFLIVRKVPNSTSSAIIKEYDSIFSEYGKPYLFHSDNGPCYTQFNNPEQLPDPEHNPTPATGDPTPTPNLDPQNPALNPVAELTGIETDNLIEYVRTSSEINLDWYVPDLMNTHIRDMIKNRLPTHTSRNHIIVTCLMLKDFFSTSTFEIDLKTGKVFTFQTPLEDIGVPCQQCGIQEIS